MNRFEQTRPSYAGSGIKIFIFAISCAFLLFLILGVHFVDSTTISKQQESLENALERSIVQCYAVEGMYPPSLKYLTEHYGLTYNTNLFWIDYTFYGSNLPPDVTVIRKTNETIK
jgi:hypothetical protein